LIGPKFYLFLSWQTQTRAPTPLSRGRCILDGIEISIATKADDAKIDLSLWNVGGDAPGMEEARGKIWDGLH